MAQQFVDVTVVVSKRQKYRDTVVQWVQWVPVCRECEVNVVGGRAEVKRQMKEQRHSSDMRRREDQDTYLCLWSNRNTKLKLKRPLPVGPQKGENENVKTTKN